MNVRLFNDNGSEKLTLMGEDWVRKISDTLRPLVEEAVDCHLPLRDVQTLVIEEILFLSAEYRLRKGAAEYKAS